MLRFDDAEFKNAVDHLHSFNEDELRDFSKVRAWLTAYRDNLQAYMHGNGTVDVNSLISINAMSAQEFMNDLRYVRRSRTASLVVHVNRMCNIACRSCGTAAPLCRDEAWQGPAYSRFCQTRCLDADDCSIKAGFMCSDLLKGNLEQFKWLCGSTPPAKICIMGGEPLLVDNLPEVISVVRRCFSSASLMLITNGLLVERFTDELLQTLLDNRCELCVSVYSEATRFVTARFADTNDEGFGCSRCFRRVPYLLTSGGCTVLDYYGVPLTPTGELYFCTALLTVPFVRQGFEQGARLSELARGVDGDVVNVHDLHDPSELSAFINKPACPFARHCTEPRVIPWSTGVPAEVDYLQFNQLD